MTQHNAQNLTIFALAAHRIKFGKNTVKGVLDLTPINYPSYPGSPLIKGALVREASSCHHLVLKQLYQVVMVFLNVKILRPPHDKICAYIVSKSLPAGSSRIIV